MSRALDTSMDREPMIVFWWPYRVDAALAGKSHADQLPILADMILDAEYAQAQGRGPSQSDIYCAKRRYNAIHELWMEERLPSTRKEIA